MQHHHPAAAGQIRGGSQIRHRGVKAVFYLFKQQQRKKVAAQCCTSAQRHGMGGEIAAKWGEVVCCCACLQCKELCLLCLCLLQHRVYTSPGIRMLLKSFQRLLCGRTLQGGSDTHACMHCALSSVHRCTALRSAACCPYVTTPLFYVIHDFCKH